MRLREFITLAIACVAAATLAPVAMAAPETLTVTRFDDPPPDGCAPADCSLREAAIVSNTDPADRDTINLSPGTYVLSIPGSGGFQGDIDLSSGVDIVNTGTGEVMINANGITTNERAIEVIAPSPATVNATLWDVSMSSGKAPLDGDNVARGGAVRVGSGTEFWMLGGRIASSSADRTSPEFGEGGAIWSAGDVVLSDVLISQNTADHGSAGAIFAADGSVNVSVSEISQNEASFGGAIVSDTGVFQFSASRLARNEAVSSGGAAYVLDGGSIYLTNSTVADNTSGSLGGGVRVIDGTAEMLSSTVTGNEASNGGGFSIHDNPGGNAGHVVLQNTIVGGNLDTIGLNGSRPDCETEDPAQVGSAGFNLVSDSQGCLTPAEGDIVGGVPGHPGAISPKLRPGGTYGGYTLTEALKPNSPAVDAGDPGASCPDDDARGLPRDLGGRCDIGAYELADCRGVIVNRIGTDDDDSSASGLLVQSDGPDGFLGLEGNDTIAGSPRADGLCGGEGDDSLKGKKGDDLIKGGPGQDVCVGGPGKDKAKGCEVTRSIP